LFKEIRMSLKAIVSVIMIVIGGLARFAAALGDENSQQKVAVFPCKTGLGVTVTEGSFISERITLEILKQGQYAVIDKYEIQNKLGLAFEFRDTCSAPSSYFEVGRKCGVQWAVWGMLSKKQGALALELHSGNVVSRSVEHSVSTTVVGSTLELADQIPPLLAELFNMSVAVSPTSSGAPKSVYVSKPLPKPITLTINSEPTGAKVYLNGEETGTTPCSKDSLFQGTFDIAFDKYGYKKFSTQITLKPDVDKSVFAKLERAFGSLTVVTTPPKAQCSLNNGVRGITPFSCDTIRPGECELKLSLDSYAPVTRKVLIGLGSADTIIQPLVTLRYLDSLKQVHYKQRQIARKIIFGAGSALCLGVAIAANSTAQNDLQMQRSAYTAYSQLTSANTAAEFDARYADYSAGRSTTNKALSTRNLWIGVGTAFLAALTISFKF
jgi:hypothetical protein